MELKKLEFAAWVRAAAKAHEDSFDRAASDAAQDECDHKREQEEAEGNQFAYMNVVDHKQFYRMTLREATASVVPAEFVEPVYLLLTTTWNDILDWAKEA